MIKKVIFKNTNDEIISAYWHVYNENYDKGIIFCHGMQSNKDGSKAKFFCDEFNKLQYNCLRFDFRYVGESECEFEDITISGEVEDLKSAFRFFNKSKNIEDISVIGSSLGATVSAIFASNFNINKLVLIAPPFLFDKLVKNWFNEKQLNEYKNNGFIEINGQKIKHDFVKDALKYNFDDILPKISCPVLFLHGTNDNVVPIENSRYAYNLIQSEKKIIEIQNGDHRMHDKLGLLFNHVKEFIL